MFTAPKYDYSQQSLHVPIDADEVDRYLGAGGRPFSRHPRMRHLLWRVRQTLDTQARDLANLKRQVEQLHISRSRVGAPTTMNPQDALRFLSPEEITAVVGRLYQSQLNELRVLVGEWQGHRNAVVADLARVRGAATELLNRPDIPVSVRAEFSALLSRLPAEPEPRERPMLLALADDVNTHLPSGQRPPAAPEAPQTRGGQ